MRVLTSVCVAAMLLSGCATPQEHAEQPMTGRFPALSTMQSERIRSIVDYCDMAINSKLDDNEDQAKKARAVVDYYIKDRDGISHRVSRKTFVGTAVLKCASRIAAQDPLLAPLQENVTEPPER